MNNFWIKLYHEILHDPKMGKLPDNVWRRCIELFLMAGELDDNGQLPSVDDIAWKLRVDEDQLRSEIDHLIKVGILTEDDTGLYVTNFCTRQGRISAAEKQRAYRERKRTEAVSGNGKNGNEPQETPPESEQNQPVTDQKPERYQPVTDGNADIDKDIDKNVIINNAHAANLKALTTNYEDVISVGISPIMADELREYAGKVKLEWIPLAFKVAEANNVRKWVYVRAILDNCITAGRWVDKPKGTRQSGSHQGYSRQNHKRQTIDQKPWIDLKTRETVYPDGRRVKISGPGDTGGENLSNVRNPAECRAYAH